MSRPAEVIPEALQCDNPGCACHKPPGHAHCLAHNDPNPSLSVSERGGKTLVKCLGGCSQEAVIRALKEKGLWSASAMPAKASSRPFAISRFSLVTYYPPIPCPRKPDPPHQGWEFETVE
jgi:hypothetical protein